MPNPIALCIETISQSSSPATRYVQCVALPGGSPGLSLSSEGKVLWQQRAGASCNLWVSADACLILLRLVGSPDIIVWRAGRFQVVPEDKPVVRGDQDEISMADRRLRVHVHGVAKELAPPTNVAINNPSPPARSPVSTPIQVRTFPPMPKSSRTDEVPVYSRPRSESTCFIATAACGSKWAPEVVRLRKFRDTVLRRTPTGRKFIHFYETRAPRLASVIAASSLARWGVRWTIVKPASWMLALLGRK
jgi:hypothetical protein